jgi:AcrR family transcriptional regulator
MSSTTSPAATTPGVGATLSQRHPVTEEEPPSFDGRVARGERTRRAIAEALIALLEEGEEFPTSKRIAERAGVSLRIVFHHFEDLESVLRAAVAIQTERHWTKVGPVDSSLDLKSRIRILTGQRATLYEAIAPARRAAAAMERRSETISRELAHSRAVLRRQIQQTFGPELGSCPPSERRRLLDAIDTASAFEAWDGLRRMGRSTAQARRTMELLIEAVLDLQVRKGGDI